MKLLTSLAAIVMMLAAAPAIAAEVTARDPQGVLKALQDLGYQAAIRTGTEGTSTIGLIIDGSPSYIDFWNCADDGTMCETLMLVYGLDLPVGTTPERANEWNAETIHGFIYVDTNNDPWLNLTVATGAGIPDGLFANIMRGWRTRVGDARKFFDM